MEQYQMEQTRQKKTGSWLKVTPAHCHKVLPQNAFITHARKLEENLFSLIAEIDHQKENFFFDHDIEHVPGMLTSCIIRQAALVISHFFLGIEMDQKFILNNFNTHFFNFCELVTPIEVQCSLQDTTYKNGVFSSTRLKAQLKQGEILVATGEMNFMVVNAQTYARFRNRKKNEVNQ